VVFFERNGVFGCGKGKSTLTEKKILRRAASATESNTSQRVERQDFKCPCYGEDVALALQCGVKVFARVVRFSRSPRNFFRLRHYAIATPQNFLRECICFFRVGIMLGYPNTISHRTRVLLERNARFRARRVGLPQHRFFVLRASKRKEWRS
jgi:hypothetical protein